MSLTEVKVMRSFIITVYNGDLKERVSFAVPRSITAPFFNRLIRELMAGRGQYLREPWYLLIPRAARATPFSRAPYPAGATSLYGTRYVPEDEPPPRVTLHPNAASDHFTVHLLEFKDSVYQGDYGVNDLFLALVEILVRKWIEKGRMGADDGPFYYAVLPSPKDVSLVSPDILPPKAYEVEGVFRLPRLAEGRERTIFHKVPPQPLPVRAPTDYGKVPVCGHGEGPQAGAVFMSWNVYDLLLERLQFSASVEDGGYLLGVPYRQPGSPEDEDTADFRWLVEITDVIQAEAALGNIGSLLFTGETWSRVTRRRDRDYPDKKLVAWFHTHLFEASDGFGLSGMDQDLHRRFMTKPWQVAVLINIGKDRKHTVRCYQRSPEGDLVECVFMLFGPEAKEQSI